MAEKPPAPILGAVPVIVTPFNDDGAIDLDSLCRQIDFCIEAGSHALAFGMGSESSMLTDAEREQVWRTAATHLNRRIPLVAAPYHPSREGIIALAQLARDCGADCAMINPETRRGDALVGLFRDLSEQVGLPLMVQDAQGNAPVETLLQAVREAPRVICLKIECPGAPHKIGQIVQALKPLADRAITVLGGSNGAGLREELERGSVGTMPHPAIIDAFRTVCDRYANGDVSGAEAVYYTSIMPLNRLTAAGGGMGGGIWLHKTIFHRVGILRSARCRIDTSPQPDWIMDKIWTHLKRSSLCIAALL